MLSATIKYGAARAKVMALYGRMLTEDNFTRLCACGSLSEAAAVLRSCPGWADKPALAVPAPSEKVLKDAVEGALIKEYASLWSFCSRQDREFLSFILRRGELEAILLKLQTFRWDCPPMNPSMEKLLRDSSSLDMEALAAAKDYPGILAAAKRTIYAPAMNALKPARDSELPDYRKLSVSLENECYRNLFSYVGKNAGGRNKLLLTELLGTEADLLNLVNIMRIIKYFPDSASEGSSLLIPVYNKLTPRLAERLMTAGTWEEAKAMMAGTSLGRMAEKLDFKQPERAYIQSLESFCRRLIRLPEPSVCTVQAYLTLKEQECKRLMRIIEAIDCGADPARAL